MVHVDPLFFIFGYISLLAILYARAMRDGSRRVPAPQATIAFRTRTSDRLLSAFIGLSLALCIAGIFWSSTADAIRHHRFAADEAFCVLVLGAMFVGPLLGMFLYFSGPCDLSLDLARRTYRFVYGWPQHPRVLEGPWEDMAGVYIVYFSRSGCYHVKLAWRREKGMCPTLGTFGSEGAAEAFADEISALLGLPRVKRPPLGQTSVNPILSKLRQPPILPPFRPFRPSLFLPEDPKPTADPEPGTAR